MDSFEPQIDNQESSISAGEDASHRMLAEVSCVTAPQQSSNIENKSSQLPDLNIENEIDPATEKRIDDTAARVALELDSAPQNWPPGATDINLSLAMDSFSGHLQRLADGDMNEYNRLLEEVADATRDSSHPFHLRLGTFNLETNTYDNVELWSEKQQFVPYMIAQPGDTLSQIAADYNDTFDPSGKYMEYLAQRNNLSDPNKIAVGQAISIWSGTSMTD